MGTTFHHTDLGIWSADASDLGLRPGVWPARISAAIDGETREGVRSHISRDREGDVRFVDYRADGVTLRVWND